MDNSGSVSETCNFYSNAVNRLEDSDEEDLSFTKPEVLCEPLEKSVTLKNRRQRRKGSETAPISTRGRRSTRLGLRSSAQQAKDHHSEILNIIEINDDSCSTSEKTNWQELNADEGEIVWESAKTTEVILEKDSGEADLSISCIDIDDEVAFHVKWRMKAIKTFHLKKTDTMKQIFQHFSQEEGILENQILLLHNGKPISPYDTPEKFKGSVVVMLEGRLKTGPQPDLDPNQIELKVLTKDKKDKLSVFILRSDNLEVFMEKAAKLLDLPRSQLLFKFDGEILDSSDTPESLDLDGGECIEAIVRA